MLMLQCSKEEHSVADETNIETKSDTTVEAAVKPVQAVAAKAEKVATAPVRKAKRTVAKRRGRKPVAKVVEAVRKNNKRAVKAVRRTTKATASAARAPIERISTMTNDFTPLFSAFQFPGADRFQGLFTDVGGKSQELAAKGQKAAEQFSELAKANIEALTEAGRIAATGAKSIGQDALESSRDGLELASQNVKTLAGATSPTEFVQLQSELMRASFDRFVSETSKLTERAVKLAGEAIQPISNRASVNAERVNELMA